MAAKSVKWEYVTCERKQSAALVDFTNGTLRHGSELGFARYQHCETDSLNKRSQEMLVAESNGICYVGQNFGPDVPSASRLCRYFVGVLNKNRSKLKVCDAQIFRMVPKIPGEMNHTPLQNSLESTFREKVDLLTEAFGSHRRKRALSSRRLNVVGSEKLEQAVAAAAHQVIEEKGAEALSNEVSHAKNTEQLTYLPPCCPGADSVAEIYSLSGLILEHEFQAIREVSSEFLSYLWSRGETIPPQKSLGQFTTNILREGPPSNRDAAQHAACLWYLETMLAFSNLSWNDLKRNDPLGPEIPPVVAHKLMDTFTTQSYSNDRMMRVITPPLKDKLNVYVLAIALHVSAFCMNITHLRADLKVSQKKIIELANAMGLKIKRPRASKSQKSKPESFLGDYHWQATLKLPFVLPEPPLAMKKKRT
uniref:DNA-directed RNA polymerase I subunit RPA49 isoform X2 n=1 Tax=Myxine glutinosa TaxID=7769 RepID=UPI00358E334F